MTASDSAPLLTVRELAVTLGSGRQRARILKGLSFDVREGSVLGIVGESGSGKSTLAKTIVGIHRPDAGTIRFAGSDLVSGGRRTSVDVRRSIQLIPQDPYSSLDPRRTIAQTLAEAIDPRRVTPRRHRARIEELLALVQLDAVYAERMPHELSGGQRQRIAIARALAVEPRLVIADEVTSALDVSTQAEIVALLRDLRSRLGLTMMFVSHNLAVVQQLSDDLLVLLHGDIVESGPADRVFRDPAAAYTRSLIDSVPGGPGFDIDARLPAA
jgi:ABC-type glutathione transport system ATPase component